MNDPLLPNSPNEYGIEPSKIIHSRRTTSRISTTLLPELQRRFCFITTCCSNRLCCKRKSIIHDSDYDDSGSDEYIFNSGDDFLLHWFGTTSMGESLGLFVTLMKDIFVNHGHELSLSNEFIDSMLKADDDHSDDRNKMGSHEVLTTCNTATIDVNNNDDENDIFLSQHLELYHNEHYVLKGVPSRPFYKTLAIRILLLQYERLSNCTLNANEGTMPRPLIDATELGFTELKSNLEVLDKIPRHTSSITKSDIISYLNDIEIMGILEYLGLRFTMGTAISDSVGFSEYLESIPNAYELVEAASEPCRPLSNPPRLTLAGRARAKHAHRGSKDQFFGICKGSTMEKNEAAKAIVTDMVQRAVWINLHVFGGVKQPVLEIRTKEGYGARWSIQKIIGEKEDTKEAKNIKFRGFLEPQMHDGFEKKWRH